MCMIWSKWRTTNEAVEDSRLPAISQPLDGWGEEESREVIEDMGFLS